MQFAFVSGNPALDLAATVSYRRLEPIDALATPADLESWVAACDDLPLRVSADAAGFRAALTLREAFYQLAFDRIRGVRFAPSPLRALNGAAAEPEPTVTLSDAGLHMSGDLPAALSRIARSGIALLADPHARLKECGGGGCTRIFIDRSPGGRRTWCGMGECGNRVKAAAYRDRRIRG